MTARSKDRRIWIRHNTGLVAQYSEVEDAHKDTWECPPRNKPIGVHPKAMKEIPWPREVSKSPFIIDISMVKTLESVRWHDRKGNKRLATRKAKTATLHHALRREGGEEMRYLPNHGRTPHSPSIFVQLIGSQIEQERSP